MIFEKDVVFLSTDDVEQNCILQLMRDRGTLVLNPLKKINKFQKALRRVSFFSHLFYKRWLVKQDYSFPDYKLVIVMYSIAIPIARIIREKNPDISIVVWNPNSLFSRPVYQGLKKKRILFSSFDPNDCKRLDWFYNPDFLFSDLRVIPAHQGYDFLFLGKPRGRECFLKDLEKQLVSFGYKCKFIMPSVSSEFIPYFDYLSLVSSSKVIVDITREGQSGLTLRPYESLFFGKKLLTNNKTIFDSGFYNANNVLVISSPLVPRTLIDDFFNSPSIVPTSKQLQNNDYLFWLNRFPTGE